ncbi:MAG: energy transducer TonB [Holophaga sp.]|nr:energy transducer TonB [Holophaga sp.]
MPLSPQRPRPLTFFEADDPTLDPEAIAHALPPRDKLFPGVISLVLYGTLTGGLILWPELLVTEPTFDWKPASTSLRHMDISLEPGLEPIKRPGPMGGGSQGTGGQTPRVALAEPVPLQAEEIKSQVLIPVAQTPVDYTLPAVPGGNGLSPGRGPGTGGGTGGGHGAGSGIVNALDRPNHDFAFVPVNKNQPHFSLATGQAAIPAVVTVQVTLDAEGRVTAAKAVNGPEYLWANAEQSALKWTFEPLAKHGFKAPQTIRILFHYSINDFKR